jgi:DNA-binding PadR family transcriptional regulator
MPPSFHEAIAMKSLNRLGMRSIGLPLSADDIVEFHAARLLLLMRICGVGGRIDGLTKLAKLDFFARYPDFFEGARRAVEDKDASERSAPQSTEAVESAMVRHRYGPWDKRYYHVLAHLEAKRLITVTKEGSSYRIALTELGRNHAKSLMGRPSFGPLVQRMQEIKKTFRNRTGSSLKNLIYELFDKEVGRRPMGQVIRQ